jgi:hypothetical protein
VSADRVRVGHSLHPTGREKFGALVGDNCRLGAARYSLLARASLGVVVGRAALSGAGVLSAHDRLRPDLDRAKTTRAAIVSLPNKSG